MSWTKIKARLKPFLHETFAKRVQFHITSYHRDARFGDIDERDLGRAWITLDGEEIYSVSGKGGGEISRQDFYAALKDYPDQKIENVFCSPLPFVRAIACMDRRIGKRKLEAVDLTGESEVVRRIISIRLRLPSD